MHINFRLFYHLQVLREEFSYFLHWWLTLVVQFSLVDFNFFIIGSLFNRNVHHRNPVLSGKCICWDPRSFTSFFFFPSLYFLGLGFPNHLINVNSVRVTTPVRTSNLSSYCLKQTLLLRAPDKWKLPVSSPWQWQLSLLTLRRFKTVVTYSSFLLRLTNVSAR